MPGTSSGNMATSRPDTADPLTTDEMKEEYPGIVEPDTYTSDHGA